MKRSISVPGVGRVSVQPDVATLRLGVLVVRQTAAAARESAAATMNAVLEALNAKGVAKKDLRTAFLSLNPVTDYSPETGPRVTGYQAANSVAVTVRDLAQAGALIDAALSAGATSMDGLDFTVDDPSAAEEQARKAAMADAERRAETIAQAAGLKLGNVTAVSEGSSAMPVPFPAPRAMAFKAEAADTPVEAGSQEIVVSVSVSFAIDG
ncbi:MAG TPA: SIMPL domain-containing protein [Candidatus Limnocylindria bacterium]|nr:SIMPL domain-containing protein [Candidatus Limnocylindria bacterium]